MDKNYRNTKRSGLLRSGWRIVTLTAVWLGISVGVASAQAGLYGLTTPTGSTYTSLTGGTAITDAAQLTSGTSDDGYVHVIMPFPFTLAGVTNDSMTFSTNYWVGLGHQAPTAAEGRAAGNLFTGTLPNNTIAPWLRDGNANFGTTGLGEMRHGLDPLNAGVYVFEWFQATGNGFSVSETIRITMQVKLYGPASSNPGRIEFHYGPTTGAISTSAAIGIEAGAGGTGNYLNALTNSSNATTTSSAWPGANFVYRFDVPAPMAYSATQVLGITNRGVGKGTVNQAFAVLNVQTTGGLNPVDLTSITVNTGSTALANIENLKVYYTGTSTTLSLANQFGSTVAVPAASNVLNGTTTLTGGNNYFWILYDVKSTATTGDSIRAIIPSVTVAGVARVVADSAAALPRGVAAPLSGTVNVGTGQTYTNLTALFGAVGTAGLSGNLTANITSNITEPAAAALGQWNELGGSGYTLNIRATGGPRTISGAVSGSGVIVLNGVSRVNIDGRIGGTGRNIIVENTSAATTQVGILLVASTATPAMNNVVRNLLIRGSLNNTGTGTVVGIQAQGNGHDSLLITENQIVKNNFGINVFASATPKMNVGVRITNNVIGSDVPADYVTSRGILANIQGGTISGNKIYNFVTTTSAAFPRGIETGDTTVNTDIFNNIIDRMEYIGTSNRAGQGIFLNTATAIADANVKVYNNTISDLRGHGSATATNNSWGIIVALGKGYHIWNNSISITENRIVTAGTTDFQGGILINSSAVTNLDIRNNNIFIAARASGTNGRMFGIRSSAAATSFDTLDYNNIYVDTLNQGVTGFLTSNRNSLADWQTATGKEANSKAIMPNFQALNLLIPNSVALDNSGTPIAGLTTDITGATRNATTPDIGAYEFSPINTDITALAIGNRVNVGCFTNNENFSLLVRNTGLQALNFANNGLSVRLILSGAAVDTETVVINTGTLNPGDTLIIPVNSGFNMSAFGNYTLSGNATLVGDGIAANNNFNAVNYVNVTPLATPFGQTFDSGTSTAAITGWTFDSGWSIAASHGRTGNGLYFNLWNAASGNPKFAMPRVGPISPTTNFSFSYRIVDYDLYPADSTVLSAADSMVFEISTDCGLTYTNLYKIDSANHTRTTQWATVNVPMSAYVGQNVQVRFRGHWSTGDWFLDLDNIIISDPLRPFALLSPANNTNLNTAGYASTTINASWASAQTGPVVYRWQLDTIAGDFSNPYLSLLSNNNGADTSITLSLGTINDFLDGRGIAVGGTLATKWRVTATYGAQLGISTNTNNLTLVRGAITPNCPVTITPTNVVNATVCGSGPATVSAQGVGPNRVVWYDGTAIGGSGTTYSFANVTTATSINAGLANANTDTFYAIGAIAPTTGANPASNFTNGMFIRVFAPIRIDSITFRSTGPRQGTMQIWNANPSQVPTARVLQAQPWEVTGSGVSKVPVEVYLTPGSYYINNTYGAGTGIMFRSTSGGAFPYVVPGKMSIDSSWLTDPTDPNWTPTSNLTRVYYFFDMSIVDACFGPTVAATVSVTPAPPATLPYSANLEGAGIPCNFINAGAWQSGTATSLSGAGFTIPAPAAGTGIAAAKTAGRLISPSFNLSSLTASSTLNLTFNAYNNGTLGSKAIIEVSLDSGVTFVRVDSVVAGAAWQSKTVNLSAYAGRPSVHFAFNHEISGGAGSGFAIDNIALNSSCGGSQVVVNIRTDIYGSEITWSLRDSSTNALIASGGPYPDVSPYNAAAATHIDTLCVPSNTTMKFRINDSYGDGLWDGTNAGTYTVSLICPTGLVTLFAGADSLPYGSVANPPQYDTAFVTSTCFIPDTLSVFNLLTPANNTAVQIQGAGSQTVDFTWQNSTRSVGTTPVTYTWSLETATANPVTLTTRTGLTSPSLSLDYGVIADTLTARGLNVGGAFSGRWKVVATSGTLTKEAVAKFNISLTRGVITSVAENALGRAMNLYPNPATNQATLSYNFDKNVDLKVVLVNPMGQEVLSIDENNALRGEVTMDISNLQSGMYFVRISDGNSSTVKRLMIQR